LKDHAYNCIKICYNINRSKVDIKDCSWPSAAESEKKRMTKNYWKEAFEVQDETLGNLIAQAEIVKQLLSYCSCKPGATITITVAHDDGQVAIANLYDHAAFVQSLYDALEGFQNEL
jgi:hypothetical protein